MFQSGSSATVSSGCQGAKRTQLSRGGSPAVGRAVRHAHRNPLSNGTQGDEQVPHKHFQVALHLADSETHLGGL